MMFHSDITFVLALIALAMGVIVLLKVKKEGKAGVKGGMFLGHAIVVLAIIVLLFSGYKTIRCSHNKCMRRHAVKMMMMQRHMQNKRQMLKEQYKLDKKRVQKRDMMR
jgi:hypothetical protein